MIYETLGQRVDIFRLQNHLKEYVLNLPPQMVGSHFGGWSVFSSLGTYTDGWASGQLLYDKNFRPDLTFEEKIKLLGVKSSAEHIRPTEICTGYLNEVMDQIKGLGLKPRRARLSLLKAQGFSTRHRDHPEGTYGVRLHIPIMTNPGCTFECEEGSAHMPADGSIYILSVSRLHQVFNRGESDRIHLIMDITDESGVTKHHRKTI
jgi:hypothetical protein